jgi:predicted amidohydrolase YtcJ
MGCRWNPFETERAQAARNVPPMRVSFVGGWRWSAGSGRVPNRSVVVEGKSIVGVDSDPSGTEVIEVGDRFLVPGFTDAHVHPMTGGMRILTCDLTEMPTRRAAEDHVSRTAGRLGAGEWLTGGGWLYEWYEGGCPPAALLDSLSPDRPAALHVRDGHSTWANSEALRRAGVTAATPDPPDGRIERLPDGTPQGTLHEGAMRLLDAVLPVPDEARLSAALTLGTQYLFSKGVTGWQDAWVTDSQHHAYLKTTAASDVVGALWWDRDRGLDQVDEILDRSREGSRNYRPTSVKLMLDGVCENFTASLNAPYLRHPAGDHTGIDFIPPEVVEQAVVRLDEAGLQCHFHAIGDRAVRHALNAVEAARKGNGWSGPMHHIAHLQVIDPVDVPRFAELRVAANCQPLWACNEAAMTEMTIPFLGEERASWQYPFGSLARSGALLAMGSDWPVSSGDVMDQISVAVRRLPPGDDGPPILEPRERLSLDQALTGFTLGSSVINGDARRRGRVRVGNVADLVLLDRDPFASPDPAGIKVQMTMSAGLVVFDGREHQ